SARRSRSGGWPTHRVWRRGGPEGPCWRPEERRPPYGKRSLTRRPSRRRRKTYRIGAPMALPRITSPHATGASRTQRVMLTVLAATLINLVWRSEEHTSELQSRE